MSIRGASTGVCGGNISSGCPDEFGCPGNVCPDFVIKRHDTKPPFRVGIEDCDGALDLTDETLVLEVNMWANAKLKKAITSTDTYFSLADNIGFEQAMVGDIIVMHRTRLPEHMLVIGFDETNNFIQVQRAYSGTQSSAWKKGNALRIFRVMNSTGEVSVVTDDVTQPDGSTLADQVIQSLLVYEWRAKDTCLPGCYWLEFKLLKMESTISALTVGALSTSASVTPSFTPSTLTADDFGCILGDGVEWVRRFPSEGEGFLIKITGSPTTELL